MPIVIADNAHEFTLLDLPLRDLSVEDLYQETLAIKRANCPHWTDESTSDFGVQLLRLFATLHRWALDHAERIKDNCYIGTARDRESMRHLCVERAYQLSEASPAAVKVRFTCEAGHPEFTIPGGTKVATLATGSQEIVVFETNADQVVAAGQLTVDIDCTHGETIADEILGSSGALAGQHYYLSRSSVIWHSETIEVFSNVWTAWTRVENFVNSSGSDSHYRTLVDEHGNYLIAFGDGINGRIPPRGTNNIRASYRQGGGLIGNVAANQITQLLDDVDYVESVSNASAASGGADRESLEHARLFAPASIKSLDRGVTTADIKNLSLSFSSARYGSVAQVATLELGGNAIRVMIVPKSGGLPSSELKSELLAHLNTRRTAGTYISVHDPEYQLINVTAELFILKNFSSSQVAQVVRNRLVSWISPIYQDPSTGLYPHEFGRNVYFSDLIRVIDETDGVDHVTMTAPSGDIVVDDYRIADVGTIALTVNSPQAEPFAFISTRDDVAKYPKMEAQRLA